MSDQSEVPTELTRAAVQARAVAPLAAAGPSYASGFDGAAMAPFDAKAAAVLGEAVNEEEVEVRDDGIVYMPGVWYRRQLFRAFGPGAWALLPRGPARKDGQLVLYHGALYILGRFVSEALGECETRWKMTYASALEGARTDCLSRCCKDLGMAAELWDRAWRDSWLSKYTVKEWKNPSEAQLRDDPKAKGRWIFSRINAKKGAELVEGRNAAGPEDVPEMAPGFRRCEFCDCVTNANMRGCCAKGAKADADAAVAATVAENAAKANAASAEDRTAKVNVAPPIVHDKAPDDVPTMPIDRASDTGEAPPAKLIAELQKMAKELKWSGPHARNWLKKHFGVESSGALTAEQAWTAHDLLVAAQVDDDDKTYGEARERLIAEGKVRG